MIYGVFGRGEIVERKMQAREIGERYIISYVWLRREMHKSKRRREKDIKKYTRYDF